MDEEGCVRPANEESRLVMVQLEPIAKTLTSKKPTRSKSKPHLQTGESHVPTCRRLFNLRKHVAVWKSLMATQAHDVRLNVRRKGMNVM